MGRLVGAGSKSYFLLRPVPAAVRGGSGNCSPRARI
jgi:hypothetical protein